MASGIAIRVYRHVSQTYCPWNVRFASGLKERTFAAREVISGKDARRLARDIIGMSQEEFSRAFKGAPVTRAKLRGLQCNAAVVLGYVGSSADVPALLAALSDDEPLARGHAAWAFGRVRVAGRRRALRARLRDEPGACVCSEIEAALQAVVR